MAISQRYFDIRSLLTWINFSCSNIFKELVSLLLSPQPAFLIETGCKGKGFFQISKAANHFFFRICFKERLPKQDYCTPNAHRSFRRHNPLTVRQSVMSACPVFVKNLVVVFRLISGSGCKDKRKRFKLPNQSETFFLAFFLDFITRLIVNLLLTTKKTIPPRPPSGSSSNRPPRFLRFPNHTLNIYAILQSGQPAWRHFWIEKISLKSGNNVVKSTKREGGISKYSLPLTVIGESSGSDTLSPEAKKQL